MGGAWEHFFLGAEYSVDPSEMWRVIRSLSGDPTSLAPNEALVVEGLVITTNPKKADSFARHYTQVSKLCFTKAERNRKGDLKKNMTRGRSTP